MDLFTKDKTENYQYKQSEIELLDFKSLKYQINAHLNHIKTQSKQSSSALSPNQSILSNTHSLTAPLYLFSPNIIYKSTHKKFTFEDAHQTHNQQIQRQNDKHHNDIENSEPFSDAFYEKIANFLDEHNLYISDLSTVNQPPKFGKKLMSLTKFQFSVSTQPSTLGVLLTGSQTQATTPSNNNSYLTEGNTPSEKPSERLNFHPSYNTSSPQSPESALLRRRMERAISINTFVSCCDNLSQTNSQNLHEISIGNKNLNSFQTMKEEEEAVTPLIKTIKLIGSNSLPYTETACMPKKKPLDEIYLEGMLEEELIDQIYKKNNINIM